MLWAAFLGGAAPLAVTATTSSASTTAPFSPSTTTHLPKGVNEAVSACSGTHKQITETLSAASITADATSTSTAVATVTATATNAPQALCKGAQVIFTSSDSNELVSATTDEGDGTYSAIVTSSKATGHATITAQLTVVNPAPPPLITFVGATATLTQTAAAPNLSVAIAVPAAGSLVTLPATAGVGLIAFGVGLLVAARRLRVRRHGLRRLER
jgi:adhesin/invasin